MPSSEDQSARKMGRDAFRAHLRRHRTKESSAGDREADVENTADSQLDAIDETGSTTEERRADRIAAFEKDEEFAISRITGTASPPLLPIRTKEGKGVESATGDRFLRISTSKPHSEARNPFLRGGDFRLRQLLTPVGLTKVFMILLFTTTFISVQYLCGVDKICFASGDDKDPAVPTESGNAVLPVAFVIMFIVVPACCSFAEAHVSLHGYHFVNAAMMFGIFIFFAVAASISNSDVDNRDFRSEAEDDWPSLDKTAIWFYETPERLADQRRELINDVSICASLLAALTSLAMLATLVTAYSVYSG